jgi:drug/metabolite transporter (DMT)-like permease
VWHKPTQKWICFASRRNGQSSGIVVVHILMFVALGAFWGASPSFYKLLGASQMPITHIIVLTGIGVGIGLWLVARWRNGRVRVSRALVYYGMGCGILLNIPFALQILLSRHVGAAEMAIVFSTAPFFNYLVSVTTGRDRLRATRIFALLAGFSAGGVLILTRNATGDGFSWWLVLAFACPVLYAAYNWFTSNSWPDGVDVNEAGMAESFASGLVAVPFLIALALPGVSMGAAPPLVAYWPVAALTLMWIGERIVYFTLIRDRGPVYTVQAIYISAPAGVLYGIAFFGETPDIWLWVSLALVILALWLNNRPDPNARQVALKRA